MHKQIVRYAACLVLLLLRICNALVVSFFGLDVDVPTLLNAQRMLKGVQTSQVVSIAGSDDSDG